MVHTHFQPQKLQYFDSVSEYCVDINVYQWLGRTDTYIFITLAQYHINAAQITHAQYLLQLIRKTISLCAVYNLFISNPCPLPKTIEKGEK